MANRFCGNCGHELSPDDRFCPNCGKPVHETAVLPTPEAEVAVPPLPQQSEEATSPPVEQAEPPPALSTAVKVLLAVVALLGVIAVATQDGAPAVIAVIFLIVAGIAYFRPVEEAARSGEAGSLAGPVSAEPISEAQRSRLLDDAIGGYLRRGFFVRLRTPTTAQLVRPKKFSFISALLWFLVFGIGILIYLFYYASQSDQGVYLQVDEYGDVTATRQRG